jgi:crotonobetainyl-CoA:carnitine CoA-transferase CaiB-like acyl-CoA transferase
LADDPRLAHNAGRVEHEALIDTAIGEWTAARSSTAALADLESSGVPAGPIYSVADMALDPHYASRGMFERVRVRPASSCLFVCLLAGMFRPDASAVLATRVTSPTDPCQVPALGEGRTLAVPAIAPRLTRTPGETRWAGPEVGSHNEEVWQGLMGMSSTELGVLREAGVI